MRRALSITMVCISVLSAGPVSAARDPALRHPAIQEVLLMFKGGVDHEVIAERVRRMEDVPTLDAKAVETLVKKGIPDKVLLELARRKKELVPCGIRERRTELRDVFGTFAIQRVLHQVSAGVATREIVERVRGFESVPELDGRAIEKLTNKGVPDKVILELVRREAAWPGCDPVRAELLAAAGRALQEIVVEAPEELVAATEAPEGAAELVSLRSEKRENGASKQRRAASADLSPGMGTVRVVAQSSLPVTYVEVLVDGDRVIHLGQIREAEVEPGWTLPRPLVLDVKKGAVVFESQLPVGLHEVQTTFALSRVVDTSWNALSKARGQRYDTTKAGPGDAGEVPVCEIREGATCVVLARLVKRGGGYDIAYDLKMR